MIEQTKREAFSEIGGNEFMEFLTEDFYDDALCGIIESDNGEMVAVYDEEILLKVMMENMGLSYFDAQEHYDFNIVRACAYDSGNKPKFIMMIDS